MKKICMIVLLSIFMNIHVAYAEQSVSDQAYEAYEKGEKLYQEKQYDKALKWLKMSYEEDPSKEAAFDIGLIYKKLEDYINAIEWYKKSFEKGDVGGGFNVALIYEEKLNNTTKAIEWYKKTILKGHLDSYDNISLIYHDIKKDNLTASAYYIATIDKSYTKKEILDFLRNDWKIDEATLKKAYELQKKLVPYPYYDSEFETTNSVPKKNGKSRR